MTGLRSSASAGNPWDETMLYCSNNASMVDFFGGGIRTNSSYIDDGNFTSPLDYLSVVAYPYDKDPIEGTVNSIFIQDYESLLHSTENVTTSLNGEYVTTAFTKNVDAREMTLEILADDADSFNTIVDEMYKVFKYDIRKNKPGIMVYKGWHRRCFIYACDNSDYDESSNMVTKKFKVIFTDTTWLGQLNGYFPEVRLTDINNYYDLSEYDDAWNFTSAEFEAMELGQDIIDSAITYYRSNPHAEFTQVNAVDTDCNVVVDFIGLDLWVSEDTTVQKPYYAFVVLINMDDLTAAQPEVILYGIHYSALKANCSKVTLDTKNRTITGENGENLFGYKFEDFYPFPKLKANQSYLAIIPGYASKVNITVMEERDEPSRWI